MEIEDAIHMGDLPCPNCGEDQYIDIHEHDEGSPDYILECEQCGCLFGEQNQEEYLDDSNCEDDDE